MTHDEKKTEKLGVWMSPSLMLELTKLANNEDLSVSAYVHRALHRHVFGHGRSVAESSQGPDRTESGR